MQREHHSAGLDMAVFKRKNRFVLWTTARVVDAATMAAYDDLHTTFFEEYLAQFAQRPKQRVCFVYDVRGLAAPTASGWWNGVRPFVQCHQRFREEYKEHLRCTTILLGPTLRDLIHTLFATLYRPARPVHLVGDEEEACSHAFAPHES